MTKWLTVLYWWWRHAGKMHYPDDNEPFRFEQIPGLRGGTLTVVHTRCRKCHRKFVVFDDRVRVDSTS